MNTFEYITVLASIVVGLAIADLATSAHRLLRAGGRVRWDWIAPTAALLMLPEAGVARGRCRIVSPYRRRK